MFAKCLYREGVYLAPKQWLNYAPIDHIEQVFDALNALDGAKFNSFVVSEAPGESEDDYFWSGRAMMVASNSENGYYCEVYESDMAKSVAANKHTPRTYQYAPIVIGELTDVWRYQIIGIEEAREALSAFVEQGELSDALDWEFKP